MEVITTIAGLRQKLLEYRRKNYSIGLIPTMGALHDGHISLTNFLRDKADLLITSIFVNPTQFGPNEDFQKYPRTFEDDCQKLENSGCDIVFTPSAFEMYHQGSETFVDVGSIAKGLCADFRPNHFRGVATVVLKLFHITQADMAAFGEKDYQQLQVIRQMVNDLNLSIQIFGLPTIRESNGLAMSSRNQYLSAEQKELAGNLYQGLIRMKEYIASGQSLSAEVLNFGRKYYSQFPDIRLQYLEMRRKNSFLQTPDKHIQDDIVILIAAYIGQTRLIDNITVIV